MVFQRKVGVPDAAAEEGGVLHHGFGEAVVTAPEDLSVAGLLYAAAGEFFGVDHGAVVEALQEKDGLAQEGAGENFVNLVFAVHLTEGDAAVDELLHILRPFAQLGAPAQQEGGQTLDDPVVAVAVDDVQPALVGADAEVPADHVVVSPHAQEGVQRLLIFAELVCQLFHFVSSANPYWWIVSAKFAAAYVFLRKILGRRLLESSF